MFKDCGRTTMTPPPPTDGEWSQYLTLSLRLRWAKNSDYFPNQLQNQQCGICPQQRQINLGIRPVWSEFAVRIKKAKLSSKHTRLWSELGWSESLLGTNATLLVTVTYISWSQQLNITSALIWLTRCCTGSLCMCFKAEKLFVALLFWTIFELLIWNFGT